MPSPCHARVLAILSLLIAGGCATAPPPRHDVQNALVYPDREDRVWAKVVSVSTQNMYLTRVDRTQGVLTAEEAVIAPNRTGAVYDWADCGAVGILERPISQLADVTFVVEPAPGGTRVTVSPRFSELREDVRRNLRRVSCTSTGAFEYRFLQALVR